MAGKDYQAREAAPVKISDAWLRHSAPGPVAIPPGFKITKCPTKWANGARKSKSYCPGGAATTGYAVQQGSHRAVRNLAAKGW